MMIHRRTLRFAAAAAIAASWACSDTPTAPVTTAPVVRLNASASHAADSLASTRWNVRATNLLQFESPSAPNAQAWASRMLTYLSIAQYRAALAVTEKSAHAAHASPSAAVAAASVVILSRFYTQTPGYSRPLVPGAVEQMFTDDKNAGFPGANVKSVAAGETIGRAIAETVWAHAQLDGYDSAPTAFNAMVASRPVGPNYWILEGTAVRSLWGVKPFFLRSGETFVTTPPPPATAELIAAANNVLTGMTVGSPQKLHVQDSIALFWNKFAPAGPFTAGEWNRMADDLIQSHKEKKEVDAARILAYANAAAFNAQIDCFTVKYTWWTPRPRQYAAAIVPLFATPNHPSYPSGHSCVSSAFGGVLTDAFHDRKTRDFVTGKVAEAGMSRIYAGIHYPADITAGQALGGRAAARALKGKLE